jgi:predicted amidophosphoribosyltransferase
MRHRHQPRLCDACRAPMPRQQDACSRCTTPWADPGAPSVAGNAPADPHSRIAVAVADDARAVTQAHVDMDRWVDEGGMVPFEAAALLRTTASRR